MSYLDPHTHLHRRIASATGVALIHVVLTAGLVTGLAIKGFAPPETKPLVGTSFELPPPPKDEPTPEPELDQPRADPVVTPQPLIKLPSVAEFETTEVIPPVSDPVRIPVPLIQVPATPQPSPASTPHFTPKAAVPRNAPAEWVSTNDYPRRAITSEWEGTASYRLEIGRDGKVTDCRITRSTGHDVLDETTCRMIARRARFEPAKDDSGTVVAGSYSGTITWQLPD